MYLGVLLVALGVVALSVQLGILSRDVANLIYPVVAIFIGVWLMMGKRGGGGNPWMGGMSK